VRARDRIGVHDALDTDAEPLGGDVLLACAVEVRGVLRHTDDPVSRADLPECLGGRRIDRRDPLGPRSSSVIVVPVASVISTGNPRVVRLVDARTAGRVLNRRRLHRRLCACGRGPATPPTRAVVTSKAIAMTYLFRIASTTTLVQ